MNHDHNEMKSFERIITATIFQLKVSLVRLFELGTITDYNLGEILAQTGRVENRKRLELGFAK